MLVSHKETASPAKGGMRRAEVAGRADDGVCRAQYFVGFLSPGKPGVRNTDLRGHLRQFNELS